MPRTQLNKKLLKNRDLTGASFIKELGFYDETSNYSQGEIRQWNGQVYIANKNITSSTLEGDLSNAPDVSPDWDLLKPAIVSVFPSASQNFDENRTTILFDTVRVDYGDNTLSATSGEITFNVDGTFLAAISLAYDNTTTTRNTVTSYVQLDTGSGYTDISDLEFYNYSRTSSDGRDTSSIIIPIDVQAGYKLRIQAAGRAAGVTMSTAPGACNITFFPIMSVSGPQGPVGPAGPAGDLNWRGVYDDTANYVDRDTVEFQGSTFVSTGNVSGVEPGDPDSPNTPWELVAKKGADGAGSTVVVQEDGANVQNTPHGTLNFKNGFEVADAGSGVADINVVFPKHTYMIPVWAEENAALGNNTYEWAFGNGANTPNGNGMTIYVPSNYKCELVAMSLCLRQGTATVQAVKNTTELDTSADVSVSTGQTNANELSTPIEFTSGDVINFKTTTQSGTGGPNVVTAWFRYTEL